MCRDHSSLHISSSRVRRAERPNGVRRAEAEQGPAPEAEQSPARRGRTGSGAQRPNRVRRAEAEQGPAHRDVDQGPPVSRKAEQGLARSEAEQGPARRETEQRLARAEIRPW